MPEQPRHRIAAKGVIVPLRWRQALDVARKVMPRVSAPFTRGRNGEELGTDEAALWKRTLNYRIAAYLRPARILETHPGLRVSSAFYRAATPEAVLMRVGTGRNP